MRLPVNNYVVTSQYGERILNGKKQFHDGIDFISRDNNLVYAIADGIVIYDMDDYDDLKRWIDSKHSAGNYIIIEHIINGILYYCRYLHLGRNSVSKKQIISEGDIIGQYADAGISYGAHLHFDIYKDNWIKINPNDIIGHLL